MNKYIAEIVNGKPIVLFCGNLIEKGFLTLADCTKGC